MQTPPAPDENDPYPYSFDDVPQPARRQVPPQQARRRRRTNDDEDESLGEEVLDAITDRIDLQVPGLGCVWSVVTLPFRLIGKLFDLFD